MRHCIIENGVVVNTIMWDGECELCLMPGQSVLAECDAASLPCCAPDPAQANESAWRETRDAIIESPPETVAECAAAIVQLAQMQKSD